jgi:hypothetical protein
MRIKRIQPAGADDAGVQRKHRGHDDGGFVAESGQALGPGVRMPSVRAMQHTAR